MVKSIDEALGQRATKRTRPKSKQSSPLRSRPTRRLASRYMKLLQVIATIALTLVELLWRMWPST